MYIFQRNSQGIYWNRTVITNEISKRTKLNFLFNSGWAKRLFWRLQGSSSKSSWLCFAFKLTPLAQTQTEFWYIIQLSETMFRCRKLETQTAVISKILKIPGVVKCPGAGKKFAVKCPGAGNIFCANARGCPGGGMVRVGIERDITRTTRYPKQSIIALSIAFIFIPFQ